MKILPALFLSMTLAGCATTQSNPSTHNTFMDTLDIFTAFACLFGNDAKCDELDADKDFQTEAIEFCADKGGIHGLEIFGNSYSVVCMNAEFQEGPQRRFNDD